MGVAKKMLRVQKKLRRFFLELRHFPRHPHPAADAFFEPFPARGKAGATGTKFGLMKNSSVQFQRLITIPKINSTQSIPTPQTARILAPLLSWDRMITGIREGRRPMAADSSGAGRGRSPLAMSPLTSTRQARGKKP